MEKQTEKVLNQKFKEREEFLRKSNKGITLIALVITVIVLLILAGISISMLAGDNSILQKATDAKTKTERQSIVEQARTDVLGYQAENKGTDLKKSQLQSVLEKYFKNVPDLTDMQNSEILKTKLDTLPKYGKHNIEVKEIFDGKLSVDNPIQTTTADDINSKIGTIVSGYNALGTEWQVYYSDENETFLISKNTIEEDFEIPNNITSSDGLNNKYYLYNWNSKWYSKNITNSAPYIEVNTKRTLYMCNPIDVSSTDGGVANYVISGPTIELLLASINKSQKKNITLSDSDFSVLGLNSESRDALFQEILNYITDNSICNGAYSYNGEGFGYYLATPSSDGGGGSMLSIRPYGLTGTYLGYGFATADIRPLVSIPTSKFSVNGDTVTVLNITGEFTDFSKIYKQKEEKLYSALKDVSPQEIVNGVEIEGSQTKFIKANENDAIIEYNYQRYKVCLDPTDWSVSKVEFYYD